MTEIRIGTCGYTGYDPGEGWKDDYESKLQAYSTAFGTVELQRPFYELPQVSTAERWRREADPDCEIALKAWQAVTHPWSSPTWNTHREGIDEERASGFGYFRPTDAVFEAWEETRKRADALAAPVVVLQTPPSFDATDDHAENLRAFVGTVDRGDHVLAWEPRGDWKDDPGRVRRLCDELGLVHVVDLLRERPTSSHDVAYVRLHGLNEDPYDYDYDYDESELGELADRLGTLAANHDPVYCLFNNYEKFENARALAEHLGA